MMVYVNGTDIARLVLGGLENSTWVHPLEVLEVRPEQYLSCLETWLDKHGLSRRDIEGFVIVAGPGSATSLRTSHAMVNALAFALNVKVASINKLPEFSDADILTLLPSHGEAGRGSHFALPTYARDPKITQTKRDALKRKVS